MEPSSLKILVVEDEALVAEDIKLCLEAIGYSASVAFSSETAIKEAYRFHPDLVLMDIALKARDDGIKTAAKIRELLDIPVIYLTAHADTLTVEAAKLTEPYGYIVKPFEERDLYSSIEIAFHKFGIDKQLKTKNQELEEFSYSVSHDLRAPLRAISGFSTLLKVEQEKLAIPKILHYTDSILENINKMERIIEALMALAQVGNRSLRMQRLCMNEIVDSALMEARVGESPSIQVMKGDLHDAIGDKVLIKQVFVNLLSNAVKFTQRIPEGEKIRPSVNLPTVRGAVSGWHESASLQGTPNIEISSYSKGNQITYFVRDNGVGLDMQDASKLFSNFSRLHEGYEGTGIGLAVARRIITKHGGSIWAEGKVNEGATFSFSLPSNLAKD